MICHRGIARHPIAAVLAVAAGAAVLGLAPTPSLATPRSPRPAPALVALAPAPGNDARQVIAIGPAGEVYEPDGKGAWVRHQRIATADQLASAGRAGASVVAAGEGRIYRLASNGWSAIRLGQKGKAVMSSGPRAVGAVGRQLFALDRLVRGEPAKLATAAGNVVALGGGKSTVIQTDRGLFRLQGAKLAKLKQPPQRITGLVGDRWALVDRGAVDLRSGKLTSWPAGFAVAVAALGPDDRLVGVAIGRSTVELVTIHNAKLAREPVELAGAAPVVPVGVAVDRAGRAVIALRDGRLATRAEGAWTITSVREELAAPRPGPPPAVSP